MAWMTADNKRTNLSENSNGKNVKTERPPKKYCVILVWEKGSAHQCGQRKARDSSLHY